MSNTGKWWSGVIILAILALILSLFGPFSATKNSKEMGASIKSALNSAGHNDINVNMSGNLAKLTGDTKTDSSRLEALNVAQNATCEKCKGNKERSWHRAKDDGINVAKAAIVSPYTFSAVKGEAGGVVLDGYLQNDDAIQNVLSQANTLFPGGVTNATLKAASGAPGQWREVVGVNLVNLAKLDTGRAMMSDDSSTLTGKISDAGMYDAVTSGYTGSIPAPYKASPNIQAPNVAPAPVQAAAPDACQILFDKLKGSNRINFASAKAEITQGPSMELLNTLAAAGTQCPGFKINIEGHTDWEGDSAYNQWLSEGRAKSVLAYLADNGVDTSRMSATGFGETLPIATNETQEGMAKNRRIEFKVTRSE